ncbi:hypothetical protein GCM10009760_58370 [Kitasatospora kazusensis]|uniref:Fibronectin type-III domain-containing protein n=1 Tax=Kitasatospora kazusensis TaxID=407974 RepID=A0ABN3A9M8_9ACTN
MTVVIQTQVPATTAADEPLLSYALITTPSPLKASPENPQVPEEIGEVVISVSRQDRVPADVEWIRVEVPAGTMSPDLATDLNKISPRISLPGWTVRLDSAAKEFVCAPTGSHAPIGPDTGFTIQLSDIPINRKVGTAPVTVTESSRTGNAAFKERETVFQVGKFPADFYLRNFLCEPSIIDNGGDVKLTWERSANATYELLYPGCDRDVTNRTSLDIEGIKSDTTFYLRATTGDPTNPVIRILSAQVTVLKPDLVVGNLTVTGDLRAGQILSPGGVPMLNLSLGLVQIQSIVKADNGLIVGDYGLRVDKIWTNQADAVTVEKLRTNEIQGTGEAVNIKTDLRVGQISSPGGVPMLNLDAGFLQIQSHVVAGEGLVVNGYGLRVDNIKKSQGEQVNVSGGLTVDGRSVIVS